jgi:NAD(P)-dependent dehydrogenase (short-subunit alcohol dehydrogenase family)
VRAYGETKLMNVLFTRELARRGRPLGVTAYSLHPGVIGTNLLLDYVALPPLLRSVFSRFIGTPAEGADTAVWLATAPGHEDRNGGYFVRRKPARPNPLADNQALAARLWEASEQLTGEAWPS